MKKVISAFLILSVFFSVLLLPASSVITQDAAESDAVSEFPEVFPDIIDEEELETHKYIRQLNEQKEVLNSFVFLNEDGTHTMRVFSHPVKYVDKKGEIKNITLEIGQQADGMFGSTDHAISVLFGADVTSGIGLYYGDVGIEMTPLIETSCDIPAVLSEDRRTVSYRIDGDMTYSYALTYTGIKEEITVDSYTGQNEFEFGFTAKGLRPVEKDGVWVLEDRNGETKATIGRVTVYSADRRNNTTGKVRFRTVSEEGVYGLTIVLDPDYLADENTVYPIVIDPPVEINVGADAIEDVTIYSNHNSYGSFDTLFVGNSNYGIARILMNFPGLDLAPIISSQQVISAAVEMKNMVYDNLGDASVPVECYMFVENSWTESTASWVAFTPDPDSLQSSRWVSETIGSSLNPAHRYSFTITQAVQFWVDHYSDPEYGIVFKAGESGEIDPVLRAFASSENNSTSARPSLTIRYNPYPSLEYDHADGVTVDYSYSTSMWLVGGQTVTLSTGKATSYDDADTVLHLFKRDGFSESYSWANDDYNGTEYSQISVNVPQTGYYTLLAHTLNGSAGYCNIYKNGVLLAQNAKLGGYRLACSLQYTGYQNFFTANSSDVDTVLYVMDGTHRVIAYNDDFEYESGAVGDFDWDTDSRVHQYFQTGPWYVFVSSTEENESGTAEIYAGCPDASIPAGFPDLKAIDAVKSGSAGSAYNCFAWAGGVNFYQVVPSSTFFPWYVYNSVVQSLDNFYGNTYNNQSLPRYYGATTYVITAYPDESVIDLYQKNNGTWTHASVRKPGNDVPHGYDWESKMSDGERIFHPRYALEGPTFGSVARYYKIAEADLESRLTCEESVSSGLTVSNFVTLTDAEKNVMKLYRQSAYEEITIEFFRAYAEWIGSIDNRSLSSDFGQSVTNLPEFGKLTELVSRNPVLTLAVMDLYQTRRDVPSELLLNETVALRNERTAALAMSVRETNNEISRNSLEKAVYIAPSEEANAISFIKALLNDLYNYIEIGTPHVSSGISGKQLLLKRAASVEYYASLGEITAEEEQLIRALLDKWAEEDYYKSVKEVDSPAARTLIALVKSDVKFRCWVIREYSRDEKLPYLDTLMYNVIGGNMVFAVRACDFHVAKAYALLASDPEKYLSETFDVTA